MMSLQTLAPPRRHWETCCDGPKAFHHVTGLLARPLAVKKEDGKGVASAWKAMAAGRKALSLQIATPSPFRSAQGSARHPGTWGETCRQPDGRAC